MEKKEGTRHKYQDEILEICHMNHLSAENILKIIKKKYPSIGQATVYRTINSLVERGLLNKISIDNKNYYEKTILLHGHVVNNHGEIKDFDLSEEFFKEIERKIGKKIKRLDLKVYI